MQNGVYMSRWDEFLPAWGTGMPNQTYTRYCKRVLRPGQTCGKEFTCFVPTAKYCPEHRLKGRKATAAKHGIENKKLL